MKQETTEMHSIALAIVDGNMAGRFGLPDHLDLVVQKFSMTVVAPYKKSDEDAMIEALAKISMPHLVEITNWLELKAQRSRTAKWKAAWTHYHEMWRQRREWKIALEAGLTELKSKGLLS